MMKHASLKHGLAESPGQSWNFPTVRGMLGICLWFVMVAAWRTAGASEIQAITLPHTLTLDPVTMVEFLDAFGLQNPVIDLQTLRIHAFKGEGNISAHRNPFSSPSHAILRTVPAVWQIKLPAHISPESLDISYTLLSCGGQRNALSHSDAPSSAIRVSIEAVKPRIISTERTLIVEQEPNVEQMNVIEGGVILRLFPENLEYAGTYCGTLTVTIR